MENVREHSYLAGLQPNRLGKFAQEHHKTEKGSFGTPPNLWPRACF
jgi:hypothetical protein